MKRKRLLKKITEFLDRDGRKQRKHRDELKILLKKLKRKQIDLEEKIGQEKDERRRHRYSKELEIILAQRAKGVKALQDLKES
jgi:hypothetical protein